MFLFNGCITQNHWKEIVHLTEFCFARSSLAVCPVRVFSVCWCTGAPLLKLPSQGSEGKCKAARTHSRRCSGESDHV